MHIEGPLRIRRHLKERFSLDQIDDSTIRAHPHADSGCVVVFGTVIEGVNSRIEVMWDQQRNEEFQVWENWYRYLASVFEAEPVGFGYLSRKATTMYFEFAMMWAVPISSIGVALLLQLQDVPACWAAATVVAGLLGAAAFGYFAKETHRVLCETRLELNARLRPEVRFAEKEQRTSAGSSES